MPTKESIEGFSRVLRVQKWPLFCAQATPSLCFGLIFVRGIAI